MRRRLKFLFVTIELNLLFWLVVCGTVMTSEIGTGGAVVFLRIMVFIGTAFAVVFPQLAYYGVHKRAADGKKT